MVILVHWSYSPINKMVIIMGERDNVDERSMRVEGGVRDSNVIESRLVTKGREKVLNKGDIEVGKCVCILRKEGRIRIAIPVSSNDNGG